MGGNNASPFDRRHISAAFMRFYAVGLLLFFMPWTRGLFIFLLPWSLLLAIGAAFYFHRRWDLKTVVWLLVIAVSSFLVEVRGVNEGYIFGRYAYENGLGWKICGTPVIIGLNWAFLTYASYTAVSMRIVRRWPRVPAAALLMLAYDAVLEWVAPYMQMWHFESGYPPTRNFLSWFVLAAVYTAGFAALKTDTGNRPAASLFFIQAAFFVLIGIYSTIFLR